MNIGDYMREARVEALLSQEELAFRSGVCYRSLQSYEQGIANPGIKNVIKLADALGMSIDDYVGHRIGGSK